MENIKRKFILILTVFLAGTILSGCASKKEGIVKYDDCREIIELKDGSYEKEYKDFTCTIEKTKTGKIMMGTCVNIETENNICRRAYYYTLKPELTCEENQYLTSDEKCRCNYGYYFSEKDKKCIELPN